MKITIVSGSHRNPSQSEKIGRYTASILQKDFRDVEPYLFLLADNPLPLWEQSIWEQDEAWEKRLAPLKRQLAESDAFIIIAPEWHGQVPAGLKNFFLMFNRFEMGHKPAYIIAVSSSTGGAYPVAELRMSSYKNNRLCYIPEHLIVRDVEKVFNADPASNDPDSDAYYKSRLNWGLGILVGYAEALKAMRERTQIHHDDFGNGM
jgi:NAD(P)H-dependent FMN reductase